jgi:pyruvate formate lyase activating enzyme
MGTGTILNIQKFSIHDGPGIRTTVFLKGCPLNCMWCHNPESKNKNRELMFWSDRCINCGDCAKSCTTSAIIDSGQNMRFNFKKCTKCGKCAEVCPGNAIEVIGKTESVENVIAEIKKDIVFYNESGGGVTFSGGEALHQIDFLEKLLISAKQYGIHTAIDTSGYALTCDILKIISNVDLFLYDIKHMDNDVHLKLTGVSNKLILKNLKIISSFGKKVWIRIPILPGLNDDLSNIEATCLYLKSLDLSEVFILPYTKLAEDKHQRLKLKYGLVGFSEPNDDFMKKVADKYKYYGINVKIGD